MICICRVSFGIFRLVELKLGNKRGSRKLKSSFSYDAQVGRWRRVYIIPTTFIPAKCRQKKQLKKSQISTRRAGERGGD